MPTFRNETAAGAFAVGEWQRTEAVTQDHAKFADSGGWLTASAEQNTYFADRRTELAQSTHETHPQDAAL